MSASPRPVALLVDDEPRVLSALERSLRREPMDLETRRDAAAALDRLADGPRVALVISDHRMPGMSGIDLLARVRATSPETSRILISGFVEEIAPEALAAADCLAVLGKPWEDADLKRAVRAALAARA